MLTPEELAGLEATLLPALERHHLRLLAHGLRTLQAIAGRAGEAPDGETIRQWVLRQDATAGDNAFAEAFRIQMLNVSEQLRGIAGPSCQPLDLELDDLVRWARHQADCRLAGGQDHPASAGLD